MVSGCLIALFLALDFVVAVFADDELSVNDIGSLGRRYFPAAKAAFLWFISRPGLSL